jgi:mRNA-degrading endonuclease RelE of RelBE toxin-antitoxin system
MTTLEKIKQNLDQLDERQLQQVAEFIETVRSQPEQLSCDRKHILTFLEQVRSRHPSRAIAEIDQGLQRERNSWDS